MDEYPHEFSGGMRQRAMIAMALANEPKLLIADEPTTALDVTVQAQILALMERLQRELGMAIVIITHDLGVVAEMADDIAVMYAGRIVETAPADGALRGARAPLHVGAAALDPDARAARARRPLVPIPGTPPSLINRPSGCHFHPRCAYAQPDHARIDPALEPVPGAPEHFVACLLDARHAPAPVGRAATPACSPSRRWPRSASRRASGVSALRRGARPRQALPDHARDPVRARIGAVQAVDGVELRHRAAARRSGSSARPAAARARRRG